jgi:ribose transport system substrate-binding protein
MKVLYFLPDTDNPFWREVVRGINNAARLNDMEVETVNGTHNSETQAAQVKAYADKKPDAVLITPLDPRTVSATCRTIMKSGIPVVSIDQNLGSNATASVLSGNMKGGIMAAAFVAQRLGRGKRIVRIRAEDRLESVSLRTSSFMDEVQRNGLVISHDLVANSNRNKAFSEMQYFLRKREPFDAVFAENDTMALGALDALKHRQQSPWPLVMGYNGIPEALDAIRRGDMEATVGQNPVALGEKGATTLAQIINGESFEQVAMILPELITRSSLAKFEQRRSAQVSTGTQKITDIAWL